MRSDSLLTSAANDDDVPYDNYSNSNFGAIGNISNINANGINYGLKPNFGNGYGQRFLGADQSGEFFNHLTSNQQMHELTADLSRMGERKVSPQQKMVTSPSDIQKNGRGMYNLNPNDYNHIQKDLKVKHNKFQYIIFNLLKIIY